MKVLPIFRLYQKSIRQICLILHQFNLYILLICGKKIGDDQTFPYLSFEALKMGHFLLFSKYKQKLPSHILNP